MYGVVKIDIDGDKKIVKLVSNIDNFIKPFAQKNNCTIVKNIDINELKTQTYENGKYVITNENKCLLVEKVLNTIKGYIYNSTNCKINTLAKYELIDIDVEEIYKFMDRKQNGGTTEMEVRVMTFSLENLVKYPTINIISGSKYCRTNTICNLLDKFNENTISNSYIITDNPWSYTVYTRKYPQVKIVETLNIKRVEEMLNTEDGCIVFDCVVSYRDQPVINDLFLNAKHHKKTIIVTMTYPMNIPTQIRQCFDTIFLFSEDFYSNQKRLFDHYGQMFPLFNQFREALMELTSDDGAMVINRKCTGNDQSQKIQHFKPMIV